MIQILWNPPFPSLNSECKLPESPSTFHGLASWGRWWSPSHPLTSSGDRVARGVSPTSGFAVIGHWIKRLLANFTNYKLSFGKLICGKLICSCNNDENK